MSRSLCLYLGYGQESLSVKDNTSLIYNYSVGEGTTIALAARSLTVYVHTVLFVLRKCALLQVD